MVRLVVEEAGERRAFKVGRGRITIGSGEGAKLKLTGPGIAEVHAELEVDGDEVRLIPRPGVLPPVVAGRKLQGPAKLQHGLAVQIGDARLIVELEGQPGVGAGTSHRPVEKMRSSRVSSTRRRRSSSAKGNPLVTLGITLGSVALLGLIAWKVAFPVFFANEPTAIFEPALRLEKAEQYVQSAHWDLAESELDRIPAEAELTAAMLTKVDRLREAISSGREEGETYWRNRSGTEYLESQLKRFERDRLQGAPDRSRVRVFLERCRHFRNKWPDHPDLDWVRRQESRFQGVVSLSEPMTLDDLAFKVESSTWAEPRAFDVAFAAIDEFLEDASGLEAETAQGLREETTKRRDEWVEDRLLQARHHFEREEISKSAAILRVLVVHSASPEVSDDAAARLVEFADIEAILRGYERQDPARFEEMVTHPTIRAKARELGLVD